MLYGQLYVTSNIEKHRIGNIVIIRSHDNFFKSLDKVSKYQIKGDGKQSRINCLDRKIRYQGHASKKIYGFLHSTYNFRWQRHNPTFQTLFYDFCITTNISFFFSNRTSKKSIM